MNDQIGSRPGPSIESLIARLAQLEQSLGVITERLGGLERSVAGLVEQASESRERVEAGIWRIEKQLKEHAAALASSRSAVAQTDDLVERVVEALESLQSTVLDRPAGGAASVN